MRDAQRRAAAGALVPISPKRRSVRRMWVPRFPYAVVYSEADEEIRVIAFAHTSRRPGYWKGRE
jgi:toxin ParE1/3/4